MASLIRRLRRLGAWSVGALVYHGRPGVRDRWLATTPCRGLPIAGPAQRHPLLFAALLSYWTEWIYRRATPEARERLKAGLLGPNGAAWAAHYASQPIDLSLPLLPALSRVLMEREAMGVVQVGTSSGREIAWLARCHAQHCYVGTDPYPEVIQAAARRYPEVRFALGSAQTVGDVLATFGHRRVLVFTSGALQYVDPQGLETFFRQAAAHRAEVFVLEPIARKHGPPEQLGGSLLSGVATWGHNYRGYGQAAGFVTRELRILTPTPDSALYYWHGGF